MMLKWPVRVKPEGERGLDLMRLLIPAAVFLAALSSGTAGAQAQPVCEIVGGAEQLAVNESGRYEVRCSHSSEFRDFIWALDEDIVYQPKKGLDPTNLPGIYDSRPFKEASTHRLVMWAILPDNTRSNILEWRIEVVGQQYGDDSPPDCRKLTQTPRAQVNRSTFLQLVCNDDRGWHSSEWRVDGEVVETHPNINGLTTIDLADGQTVNFSAPGRHLVTYTITDTRDQVGLVEWDIFAFDPTDGAAPQCMFLAAQQTKAGEASTWIVRCTDDRGLYDLQWIANGTIVSRSRLNGERDHTGDLTWTPPAPGELRVVALDAGGRESIPAVAVITSEGSPSPALGDGDPSLPWQIASVIIAALALVLGLLEFVRRRRPPPPVLAGSGNVQINVHRSKVGSITVPPPPTPPTQRDPSVLRQDARRLLYANGKLAEALANAQAFAHEIGRKGEERWFGWELRGLPTDHKPADGDEFDRRAPYRRIKVGIPDWVPQRGGPRPPTTDFTIFWAHPADELERIIDRLKAEPQSAGVIYQPRDSLFGHLPKLRAMIGIDPVPVMLDVHGLEGLREGLRATVSKFLDENEPPSRE
ncbi:MAG: hypothetical protein WDA16_00205 [Candidatus Thermoplasmatota archaeon]